MRHDREGVESQECGHDRLGRVGGRGGEHLGHGQIGVSQGRHEDRHHCVDGVVGQHDVEGARQIVGPTGTEQEQRVVDECVTVQGAQRVSGRLRQGRYLEPVSGAGLRREPGQGQRVGDDRDAAPTRQWLGGQHLGDVEQLGQRVDPDDPGLVKQGVHGSLGICRLS